VRKSLLIIFVLCFGFKTVGQLKLIQSPKSNAFIAQNKATRSANIKLKGEVNQSAYQRLNIKVFQDATLIANHLINLSFTGGIAQFSQTLTLKTGKYMYSIRYELTGMATYNKVIDGLLVGDVYIIQGQSNAVAASYNAFNTNYYSPYLRSYGSSSWNGNTVQNDTTWHAFDAVNSYRSGSVGQWGAVLAKHLLDSFNTPICLLNGAVGGTRIDQHQPNQLNLEDLSTIYGRLLYRIRKAQLDSNITAILYFQGESDGWNAVKHDTGFTHLYHHWKRDFPDFKKLYVIQVRDGCGAPSLQLREIQRQFEFKLGNCQTISANGLNNHDNCHYGFVNGYEKLGHQLSYLVARDFYWPLNRKNIDPPNVNYPYYSDGLHREITLVMHNPEDLLLVDNNFEQLFQLQGDPSVSIIGGRLVNNKVILKLDQSSCNITGLSYNGKRGIQPWITNKTGMGLISFFNIPIRNHNTNTAQRACKKSTITVGTLAKSGIRYSIEQLSNGRKINQSSMLVQLSKSDSFKLHFTFDSLPCNLKDSVIIHIELDPASIPQLGKDTTLCIGESLRLSPDSLNFKEFSWSQNNQTLKQFEWSTNKEGLIRLTATSLMGCSYTANKNIALRKTHISLDSLYLICEGNRFNLKMVDTFETYFWDNTPGVFSFNTLSTGKHHIRVKDSLGCFAYDTFYIDNYPQIIETHWDSLICSEATVRIDKPRNTVKWYKNNNSIGEYFYVQGANHIPIKLIDSFQCIYHDSIDLVTFEEHHFRKTIDTSLCKHDTLEIALPVGMSLYAYNNKSISSGLIRAFKPGRFPYSFVDSNACTFNGELNVVLNTLPDLSFINDTSICESDSITLALDSSISYIINTKPVANKLTLKPGQSYLIEALSKSNCRNEKRVTINSIDCTSRWSTINAERTFRVYPNPFSTSFMVHSKKGMDTINLYNTEGKLIWKGYVNEKSQMEINMRMHSNGIYILQVDNEFVKLTKSE